MSKYKQYREEWKNLYLRQDCSTTKIGEEYDCYRKTVAKHLRAAGVDTSRPHPPEKRFWGKVDKGGPDECWEWTGAKDSGGYGSFAAEKPCTGGQGMTGAHRFSYELHRGEIPDGKQINHHCDNPSCVNPNHIYAGTHEDNVQDALNRDRLAKGEDVGLAKLEMGQVTEIRRKCGDTDVSQYDLAEEYGVGRTTIQSIVDGDTWKHVD